jgi:hypothetical protein
LIPLLREASPVVAVPTSAATAGDAGYRVLLRFKLQPEKPMPSKPRKPKPFKASTAVKAAARENIGAPPPTRATPSMKKRVAKSPKHKSTLEKLLGDDE